MCYEAVSCECAGRYGRRARLAGSAYGPGRTDYSGYLMCG